MTAPVVPVVVVFLASRPIGEFCGTRMVTPNLDEPQHTRSVDPRREGRLCISAALVIYYGAGLFFELRYHSGWMNVETYMRNHLFDGFGCAALFALIFRQIKHDDPVPNEGNLVRRWVMRLWNRRVLRASAGLTLASATIAAAAYFAAGADWLHVMYAGLAAIVISLSFWTGVVTGTASALTVPP